MSDLKKLKIRVSAEVGNVSGLLLLPEKAFALLVLGHGAGAGMQHPFMQQLSQKLADLGVGTLRYQFAYMERGKGAPDRPPKAHAVIRAALQEATKYAGDLTLLAGGKSFGGRMTSQLAAQENLSPVQGLVYFGFPLHAPGKAGTERAEHLAGIQLPQLFLQGTRDTLARMDLMETVIGKLEKVQLVKIESGDHSFKTLKRSRITHEEAVQQLAESTATFAKKL